MCLKFQLTRTSTRATVARAMCRASARMRPDGAVLNVGSREILGLSGERKALDVRRWHPREGHSDPLRSGFELPDRELGQHQGQLAMLKRLEQAAGGFAELLVLAAAQDRSVRVDSRLHKRILPAAVACTNSPQAASFAVCLTRPFTCGERSEPAGATGS
jgi:hypothetical protein